MIKKLDRIELIQGDITLQNVSAVVNAANESLLGGGGVDGAIHRAAGRELLEECRKVGGCPTGEARITKGYNLVARHVIHTVGPVWRGGARNEYELLRRAYLNSLKLASENKLESVAFPSISTGVYGFPKTLAADTAIRTVKDFLAQNAFPQKVIFVCFDDENFRIYIEKLNRFPS